MAEIGKRVTNIWMGYVEISMSPKEVFANTPKLQRTDLEEQVAKKLVPFIQIEFEPIT